MKAVVYDRYGPPEVLRIKDVEKPTPEDDQILIKIRAATVGKADGEMRSFTFPLWLQLPLRLMFGAKKPRIKILGQEIAGDVEAVGAHVSDFKAGDAVMAALERFGGHAEYICVPAKSAVVQMAPDVPYEQAACLTVFGLNALHFIRKAKIKPGENVVINGAGGSIGTVMVQLAKLEGAEVTAVDSADKLSMLSGIGADHVIDFAQHDFTRLGNKFDVIIDVAGTGSYSRCLRALNPGGRYVMANPMFIPMVRSLFTNRIGTKRVLFQFASYSKEGLTHLGALAQAGKLTPVIDRTYSLDEIIDAHRYVDTGAKQGSVVVTM